eukprot:3170462-Prymnesium_polylepis.1
MPNPRVRRCRSPSVAPTVAADVSGLPSWGAVAAVAVSGSHTAVRGRRIPVRSALAATAAALALRRAPRVVGVRRRRVLWRAYCSARRLMVVAR